VVQLNVYQGESREVKDNVHLGMLDIALPTRKESNGFRDIDVRFTYDINGLLEVEVTVIATKRRFSLVIEQTPGAMSSQEIERSLAALANLKISPRDQAENKALMTRLARLYEQSLGNERMLVSQWISAFEAAMESQDPHEIGHARERLSALADQMEGSPVL